MMRHWFLAGMGTLLFASILFARPGVVVTHSGQHFEGDIKEQAQNVTITIKGIQTTVDRSDIASLIYSQDVQQLYRRRLAALQPRDVEGRITLAKWAMDQDRPDLALDALNSAMKIDPNNRQAYDFIQLIQRQRHLRPASQPATGASQPPATQTAATPPAATQTSRPSTDSLVSPGDINTIRQMELKYGDTGVRVRIDNDVRRQYVSHAGTTFRAFDAMNPADQAYMILHKGDPQGRKGVEVLSDPPALAEYKRLIQPVILSGCASCHGGSAAGGFRLYTPPVRDAVSYTNFYILTQYVKTIPNADQSQGAFIGPTKLRMLDRTQPGDSLLAQYGLPRGAAKHSHPDVPGFRPIYRNQQAQRYQDLVRWLGRSLVNVQPDYGITDVQLPATRPSTQPATKGSAATSESSAPADGK
jgi:hypothetical protein